LDPETSPRRLDPFDIARTTSRRVIEIGNTVVVVVVRVGEDEQSRVRRSLRVSARFSEGNR
jgi:hypothetical protein